MFSGDSSPDPSHVKPSTFIILNRMLYGFGSNGHHQLGLSSHDDDVSIPEEVPLGKEIVVKSISSGGNHTLFLSADGSLYGSGSNMEYQLGGGGEASHIVDPVKIPGEYQLACAGWEFSVKLDANGQLWCTGSGPKGELGIGSNNLKVCDWHQILFETNSGSEVIDIKAGLNHVVVLLSDGSVYGWGASRKGQLGSDNVDSKMIFEPVRINHELHSVTHIACGRDYTVVGNGDTGQIAVLGPDRLKVKQQQPALPPFTTLLSGWSSIHALTRDGEVISWGNNANGQIDGPTHKGISAMAIGSEHGLAILQDPPGIAAWGWSEHGNCGPLKQDILRVLEGDDLGITDYKQVTIFAGHANSWIQVSKTEMK